MIRCKHCNKEYEDCECGLFEPDERMYWVAVFSVIGIIIMAAFVILMIKNL